MCVCSLWYPAYNEFAQYLMCGLSGSTTVSALSHKRHDFRKKKVTDHKSVFLYSLKILCVKFLILRSTERDLVKNVHRSSYKVPVILVRFYWNLNFLDNLSKKTRISNFMEIRPVGAELLHADRRTKRS